MKMQRLLVLSFLTFVLFAGDLRAELRTYLLGWSGDSFGNSATATATLVLDDTVFPNPPPSGINSFGTYGIVSFEITVSGASAGNGIFDMSDFFGVTFHANGESLDLTQELIGQTVGGLPWGTGGTGDFNIFASINGPPTGFGPFSLRTNSGGAGDEMLLTNFTPADSNWTNSAGGDFNDPGNWDALVPNATINAIFNITGNYSVNLTQNQACNSLSFLDGDVTLMPQGFNLTASETEIDGTDLQLAAGSLSISGPTQSTGMNVDSLEVVSGSAAIPGVTVLGSGGTLNLFGGTFTSGSFDNSAGGTVNLDGGHFDFGTTSLAELLGINTVSGSLAGNVQIDGLTDISTLAAINGLGVDTNQVQVSNGGVLFGTAFLSVGLDNQADGELRAFSKDWIYFAGVSNSNAGEINNFDGTIEFDGSLTNGFNSLISGRGLFIANGGWMNEGSIGLSGDFSDVLGDICNTSTGTIAIGGNSLATFFDDVEMLDPLNSDVVIGVNSTAVFFGSYNGGSSGSGSAEIFGDLRPGNSPGVVGFGGDLLIGSAATTEIEIGGLMAGSEHDQINVAGDLSLSGALDVQFIDGFVTTPGQQFTIVQVDGSLTGTFGGLSEGANVPGTDLMITYSGNGSNDIVLFTDDPLLIGDVNLDGLVNLLDVEPFIALLSTGTFQAEADCNEDGVVNLLDVEPFIAILSGG